MTSATSWAVVRLADVGGRSGYHSPPPDRTLASVRWLVVFFVVTSAALWAAGV